MQAVYSFNYTRSTSGLSTRRSTVDLYRVRFLTKCMHICLERVARKLHALQACLAYVSGFSVLVKAIITLTHKNLEVYF